MRRLGPKSKTQKYKKFSFLGESSNSEASSAEAENFQSPELESDNTDYGFNYTSSSPQVFRRSMVAQPKPTGERAQALSETSQNSPSRSNTARRNTSNSSERNASERSPKRSFVPQNTSNSNRSAPVPTKKPRKQKTPRQREKMMWNQIRELQTRTGNITPKAPFGRLIREFLIKFSSDATRITLTALEALQISSEIYLTQLFSDAYVCTLHRGRVTLGVHDVRLVSYIRGPQDGGNH